ncbi:MAG: amidohydrolase family protein, partial [Clostridia bacterium]|nr:amidohydrolase family protein [Clostridia bacterium]
KIGIDPEGHSGILTGEENERAQGRIIDAVGSAISLSALARGIANFHNYCAEYGIGVVGALEGNGDSKKDTTTKLIIRLARHFGVGVRLYLQYTDLDRVAPFVRLMKHKRVGGCGDWEMDGASGSHSAAFADPYTDTGKTAPCYYDQQTADRLCAEAAAQGYQIASHAIGDLAIRRLVDAYEKTGSKMLHRIEHAEFADEETFRRICEGNYAILAQPGYSWIDKRYLHTYEQVLPQAIRDRMKFRSYYDAGVLICGSSDSPVQDMDPYLQMLGMVQFYNEQESLTPYEALTTYTVHAAKALLEGDERGTLETGKAADFFTADCDFSALRPDEITGFRPVQTYYAGKACRPMKGTVGNLVRMLLSRPKLI